MDETAREQLAKRLSAMKLKQVRNEIRALDPDADLKFHRNAIWGEYHTRWVLPNAGVSITLVEKMDTQDSNKRIGGGPRGLKAQKIRFRYVEARVEPLSHSLNGRGPGGSLSTVTREQAARQS